MASLIEAGTAGGLLRYTDDNGSVLRIVIAQIIGYRRGGTGHIEIVTAKNDLRLKLDNPTAVSAAITLLDSKF